MNKICSFCGNEEREDLKVVEGAEAVICEECLDVVSEDIRRQKDSSIKVTKKFLKPHEIKSRLDEFVVGQEEAKKVLSVAVYSHYKRVYSKSTVDIQKTNILINGPTGSGKTFIMQTLANILDVPMVIVDATKFTKAGYVGEDVENILQKLLNTANGDIEKAEKGIVYIDEVDKIVGGGSSSRGKSDPTGDSVQQALLKLIEDSTVDVTVTLPNLGAVKKSISTKNILFVSGGAFVGIDKIIEKRTKKQTGIGFGNSKSLIEPIESENSITSQDIMEYGLIPEFVGRFPVVVTLNSLTQEELKDILTKPKGALVKQYKALFKIDGVDLDFSEGAINLIVSEAVRRGVGARGLRGVIEKRMYSLMYNLPQMPDVKQYLITEDFFKSK